MAQEEHIGLIYTVIAWFAVVFGIVLQGFRFSQHVPLHCPFNALNSCYLK